MFIILTIIIFLIQSKIKPQIHSQLIKMEELQSTLVEWVTTNQINNSKLSRKCEKLCELSDGILLYEFMSKV